MRYSVQRTHTARHTRACSVEVDHYGRFCVPSRVFFYASALARALFLPLFCVLGAVVSMSDSNSVTRDSAPFPEPVETRFERDGYTYLRSERAPFDFRGTEWNRYGQSGGRIYYAVSNGRGAMSWEVLLRNYVSGPEDGFTCGALQWHWHPDRAPDYLTFEPVPCDLVDGGKCKGDAGFLIGDEGEPFYRRGDEAVFEWLKTYVDAEVGR